MAALIFLAVVAGLLFLLAFLTKRRFGVLGLALAAGSLLSTNWAGTLTPFIEQQGLVVSTPPLSTLVALGLILTPPLLLLFSGPTYQSTWPRIIGATLFMLLAFAFMLEPLGDVLRLEGRSADIFAIIMKLQSILIVIGLVAAIVDVFFTRSPKSKSH